MMKPSPPRTRALGRPAPSSAVWLSLVALFLVACSAPAQHEPASQSSTPERLHVIVLHTNDVHGQVLPRRATWIRADEPPMVGGIPRVAAYVNAIREEARREQAALFVVDAGDWFQGTPEGQIEKGLPMLRVMAEVGYDAMAVGNHELDHGVSHFASMLDEVDLPAVCSNVVNPATGQRIGWAAPWRIVEREGLRVAFVGLLATETPEITHPDARALEFVDPSVAFAAARRQLEEHDVDWVVPLTHIGLRADEALARAHPDVELVIGGHSHTYLKEGRQVGQTMICQVGSKASAVGRVDLWFDRSTGTVEELTVRTVDLDTPVPDTWRNPQVEHLCDSLVAESERRMNVVVGTLEVALRRGGGTRSSTAGNLVADVCRERTGADVALMNRGGIRRDVPAGPVTRRDVFELLPFDNHLVTVTMAGAELDSILRRAVEDDSHSGVEVSGLVIEYEHAGDIPRYAGAVIGGSPLEPRRSYSVTVNSFMAQGGDDYLTPETGSKRVEDPIFMRDALEEELVKKGTVTAKSEQRYRLVERGASR